MIPQTVRAAQKNGLRKSQPRNMRSDKNARRSSTGEQVNNTGPKNVKGNDATEWLSIIAQLMQTSRNETNEHNKFVREALRNIQDDLTDLCDDFKKGFATVATELKDNGTKLENISAVRTSIDQTGKDDIENAPDKSVIPMVFVDACSALIRYAYSLSGQQIGNVLHLFPPRATQIELCSTVVGVLLNYQPKKFSVEDEPHSGQEKEADQASVVIMGTGV